MFDLTKPTSFNKKVNTVQRLSNPYLDDRIKLIDDASGKYLQGTGISEILN